MSQCQIQNRMLSLSICVVQIIDAREEQEGFCCTFKLLGQTESLSIGKGEGQLFLGAIPLN